MFLKKHTAPHGFVIDEVLSVLQKSIRRSLPEDSIYWAIQLDISGFGNACFNRLKLIASEDIALAEPAVVCLLSEAYKKWKKAVRYVHFFDYNTLLTKSITGR